MSDRMNDFDGLARRWARTMRGVFAPAMPGGGDDGEAADARETMDRWTEANVAVAESGFHYVSRWAELSARAYPLAVEVLQQSGPGGTGPRPANGPAMDELREALREMAELPMKEYQRLQAELADVWRGGPTGGAEGADEGAEGADDESADEDGAEDEAPKRRAQLSSW